MSKVVFVAAGPYAWGSSRMRCYWPARHIKGAMVIDALAQPETNLPEDGDVFIWQKIWHIEAMEGLKGEGKLTFWDVCDPSWWWNPRDCILVADSVSGVVASSQELADDFSEWSGLNCHVIPDRLDLEHFKKRREHAHVEMVRFIWYGVSVNRMTLFAALANLERLTANGVNLSLTVYDDRPDQVATWTTAFPIYHARWDVRQENTVLSTHDIALLPPYPGPWGKVKSNNKNLTGWACGLAVTDGQDYSELYDLATITDLRQKRADEGWKLVQEQYQTQQSAADWERLIEKCLNT